MKTSFISVVDSLLVSPSSQLASLLWIVEGLRLHRGFRVLVPRNHEIGTALAELINGHESWFPFEIISNEEDSWDWTYNLTPWSYLYDVPSLYGTKDPAEAYALHYGVGFSRLCLDRSPKNGSLYLCGLAARCAEREACSCLPQKTIEYIIERHERAGVKVHHGSLRSCPGSDEALRAKLFPPLRTVISDMLGCSLCISASLGVAWLASLIGLDTLFVGRRVLHLHALRTNLHTLAPAGKPRTRDGELTSWLRRAQNSQRLSLGTLS